MTTSNEQLTESYNSALLTDSYSVHAEFVTRLLESNDKQILDYHYSILKTSYNNTDLYRRLCGAFEKRGETGATYLLSKISLESDINLKGDLIHILGKMRRPEIVPIAISYLKSEERILRYKSIIVLGWNGAKSELSNLQDCLLNDPDNELRSFAATAMRQIWHNHKDLKDEILSLYLSALNHEQDDLVNAAVLSCSQDMLLKKFGIKETQYGNISGSVDKAKVKAVKAINQYLKDKS